MSDLYRATGGELYFSKDGATKYEYVGTVNAIDFGPSVEKSMLAVNEACIKLADGFAQLTAPIAVAEEHLKRLAELLVDEFAAERRAKLRAQSIAKARGLNWRNVK